MNNEVINPSEQSNQDLSSNGPTTPTPTSYTPPSQPVTPTVPAPSNTPKKKRKPLLIALIVLAVIALAGLGYVLVDRYLKETDTNVNQVELKEVEQIRLGTVDGPANNLFPKEGIGINYNQNRQVYEGLVAEVDTKYVPLLAESWTNPDSKTWVFKIKPNVKFHTGKTLTAEDVKKSLEAIKKLDFLGYLHSTIAKVEVSGDNEVKITTTEPDSLLLNRLALSYISDQDAAESVGNNGTGPYRLDTSADYNEKSATFVAYDDYHQGRPKTRKLVYKVYENDEALNKALKDNEIEIMDTIPDEKAIAGLDEAGFSKIEFESPGTFGLYMNMLRTDSPLQDKNVRNAIALALNRESLVKELDNNNKPATQVIPKSLPGFDEAIKFPDYNLSAAKAALAKADLPAGTKFEYLYVEGVQPDAPILIKQLEAAGFDIDAVSFKEADPLLDRVFDGEFDLFSAAYTSDLADSRDLLGALLESTEQSYPIIKDSKYDQLLSDSDKELDPTKRIAILQEANKYIADNLLWVPLRSTVYVSYFKPGLQISHDFSGSGSLGVYYWQVGEKVTNQ